MTVTTITTNGRFTIPIELRRKYGLKKGTCIVITENENGFEIAKFRKGFFLRYAGILGTKGNMLMGLTREKIKERVL